MIDVDARDPAPGRASSAPARCVRALPFMPAGRAPGRRRPGGRRAPARRRAARGRGGPAARGPRQRPADPGRRALRRRASRRSRSRARRGGWSRSRRRSTAATCSRPSPRGWPPASRSRRPGTPLDPAELARIELSEARRDDGRQPRRARRRDRRLRQLLARRRPPARARHGLADRPARPADARRPRARRRCSRARSPTSTPGELLLYEDAAGALALAVNAGSAAEVLGLRARRAGDACAP